MKGKKAFVLIGSHHYGKSMTINYFFKKLVKISKKAHIFYIEERIGYIYSQSLEEKGIQDVEEVVESKSNYDMLVFAARPKDDESSLASVLITDLRRHGFKVEKYEIKNKLNYNVASDKINCKEIASKIFSYLK